MPVPELVLCSLSTLFAPGITTLELPALPPAALAELEAAALESAPGLAIGRTRPLLPPDIEVVHTGRTQSRQGQIASL